MNPNIPTCNSVNRGGGGGGHKNFHRGVGQAQKKPLKRTKKAPIAHMENNNFRRGKGKAKNDPHNDKNVAKRPPHRGKASKRSPKEEKSTP